MTPWIDNNIMNFYLQRGILSNKWARGQFQNLKIKKLAKIFIPDKIYTHEQHDKSCSTYLPLTGKNMSSNNMATISPQKR